MTASAFASLPMYDMPHTAAAWDRFWLLTCAELAARGIEADAKLRRDSPHTALWRDPDLLVGQTCGWPLVSQLDGDVVPFARFDLGLDTSRAGDYFSIFIRPRSATSATACEPHDLASFLVAPVIRIAVNSFDSQSGFRVFGECLPEPLRIDRERIVETGSHLASIRSVAAGKADIAAIDAATWRFVREHEPAAQEVTVVARSKGVPGLPLITSPRHRSKVPVLLDCVARAVQQLHEADRTTLQLRGIVPAQHSDYEMLKQPPFGRFAVI